MAIPTGKMEKRRDFINFTKDPTGTSLNYKNPGLASVLFKQLTFAQSLRNNPELQSVDLNTAQVSKTITATANHLMEKRSLNTGKKSVLQEFKESGMILLGGRGQKMYFENYGCGFEGEGIYQQAFHLNDKPIAGFNSENALSVNLYPMPIPNVTAETVNSSACNGLRYHIYSSPLLIAQMRKRIYEKNGHYFIDSYYNKVGNWLATKFTLFSNDAKKGKYTHYFVISKETYNYQYEKDWNVYNFAQKKLNPFDQKNEFEYYMGILSNDNNYIFDVPTIKVLPYGKFVSLPKSGPEINKEDFEQIFGISRQREAQR
ncbi:MAG: hypothetical protein PHH71_02905 [Clostridia bacterium]|jgi:hypothetical protein|nr:hypothetical protein [Clostridia bacterium]MDD3232118.1 hypothetical protein [Clostridia bacterium]MDD3862395.1 hypothetical protein [Clostridia bacterium]MDD4408802.1 hypothetical protein [Clostridia bacterium]